MAYVSVPALDANYGWHGKVYMQGATACPEDLAIALGVWPPEETGEDENENPGSDSEPDALTVINAAEAESDITVLPGIGTGAAGHILSSRPQDGYESLTQLTVLVPQIFVAPFSADIDVLLAWELSA